MTKIQRAPKGHYFKFHFYMPGAAQPFIYRTPVRVTRSAGSGRWRPYVHSKKEDGVWSRAFEQGEDFRIHGPAEATVIVTTHMLTLDQISKLKVEGWPKESVEEARKIVG